MKKLLYILFFVFLNGYGLAQNGPTIDSLKQLLTTAKHDTIKIRLRNEIGEEASIFRIEYWDSIYVDSRKWKIKKYEAAALNNIGFIYKNQGDISKALEYYNKSLQLREEIGDKEGTATSLTNIGVIYDDQGDIPKALEHYSKSLQLREEIRDKRGTANSLNNIGIIYQNQGDLSKALEYYGKSLQLREEIGYKKGIANSLNNIGVIYDNQGNLSKALEYYGKSLQLREEIGDKKGIASSLNNIGFIYQNQGDPSVTSSKKDAFRAGTQKALEYYGKSLKIAEEIGNKQGIATSLNNLGSIYLAQHQLTQAKSYFEKSYQLSKELGYPERIETTASGLKKVYEKQGNYKLAYHYHQEEIQMRDSLQSEENYKASVQQRAKYEYEKKAATDSIANAKEKEIKNSEIAQQQAEIKAKRLQQYGLIGGLAIVLIFAGFVYNRLKVTQQQKRIIETQKTEVEQQKQLVEKQKEVVEEKQNEILASIRYAKRIQDALLTSQSYIERNITRLRNK